MSLRPAGVNWNRALTWFNMSVFGYWRTSSTLTGSSAFRRKADIADARIAVDRAQGEAADVRTGQEVGIGLNDVAVQVDSQMVQAGLGDAELQPEDRESTRLRHQSR